MCFWVNSRIFYIFYVDTLNITEMVNKAKRLNNNERTLIELCKQCYLKIVNGRIGTITSYGYFNTCHTKIGQGRLSM